VSWTEHVRSLAEYNRWANQKVLVACEGLSEDELRKDRGGSHDNISDLLFHLGRVESWWFFVASQTEMERICAPNAPLADLREMIERIDQKIVVWAESASENDLATEVRFRHYDGSEYSAIAWQPLTTMLAHSTQHRAEIGMMLEALERSPGDLDFLFFAQERKLGFLKSD
jgi:uncharacterized damage-inducible protein DinB